MSWFLLALVSAISLASADAFTKKLFPVSTGMELVAIRFFVPAVALFPVVFFLPYSQLDLTFWLLMVLLVPLELLAMYLYLISIRDAPLPNTLPYLAFTPVFNIATAWLVLGETVTSAGLLGILLITGGAYMINLKLEHLRNIRSLVKPFLAIRQNKASLMMLGVAAIYSVTSVFSKQALSYIEPKLFGAFYYFCIGVAALLWVGFSRPRSFKVLKKQKLHYLFIGSLMVIMVISHFLAIADIEVAYMIAVKRTSLLFGLLYGYYLFHDEQIRKNLFAGLLMLAGVCAIILT